MVLVCSHQNEFKSLNGSYMCRMDRDTIIDANRFENMSRFLNHSYPVIHSYCSPYSVNINFF